MIGLGIAVRTLHLGASLALAGLFTFLLLVARPAFQVGKGDLRSAPEHFDAGLLRLAGLSLVVIFLTAFLGLWVQLATATRRPLLQALAPDTAWSLLTTTQYGRVWMIRMALMVLLGGVLWLHGREQDGRDWWALRLEVVGLAVSILVAQAWTGHSATGEGWNLAYRVTADALHLAASGVWLGSLPALFFLLTRAQRSDDPQAEQVAAEATRRFSALGLASMGLLLLSGLVNAWELVGTLPALVGTTYGRLLVLKLSLLLPLLAIAALNLLREKPRLLRSAPEQGDPGSRGAIRHLRRNVLGEVLLGCMILVVVGALGLLPPRRPRAASLAICFQTELGGHQRSAGGADLDGHRATDLDAGLFCRLVVGDHAFSALALGDRCGAAHARGRIRTLAAITVRGRLSHHLRPANRPL
jgi:copper resistance protein D